MFSVRNEMLLRELEFTLMIFFSPSFYLKHTKVKQSELILKSCCPIQETQELIRLLIYHAV